MYINQKDIAGWEKKGCGIACVGMVLSRANKEFSTDALVKEALNLNGYIEGVGWRHAVLARVIANRNIPAYAQEFTSPTDDTTLLAIGIEKIKEQVRIGNPVMVSVFRGFTPDAASTHVALLVAITQDGFVADDPDYDGGGEHISVAFDAFARAWRGYAIFTDLSAAG